MGDQFDIYRGPTGMGLTPHEKGMLDGLAKGPERVVVKHYEPPKEPGVSYGHIHTTGPLSDQTSRPVQQLTNAERRRPQSGSLAEVVFGWMFAIGVWSMLGYLFISIFAGP